MIIIEHAGNGYSAYSHDLSDCVATGKSQSEVEMNMESAIEMHLEGLREDGLPVPEPQTMAGYVSVVAD
ncbi:MAG: type II toxin-antitoxin system HicB family antitoxin [Candidatus Electryoneaceae bacterium]|nr:type II toxin-antitoxin system HicB family antitoxin [Candidatus Electryoneaceae bacterium]